MLEIFRRYKLLYELYNIFHKKYLKQNIPILQKLGIKKKYFQSISSKDFEHIQDSNISLISNNMESEIQKTDLYKYADKETQDSLQSYTKNGFAILKNYASEKIVNEINKDIEHGLKSGKYKFVNKNKIMFAIHHSNSLRQLALDKNLLELLHTLIGGEAVLFQSINFITGSEQHTHSDSVHMTTYPLGGLLGVWVALEDITEDNGPLHYYPGSHLLPYYLNKDYNNEGTKWMLGNKDYSEYEKMIETKIKDFKLEKKVFTARKGDILIWHANLFHGGNQHTNKNKTRKSVVFHYFKKGALCYHEITQRPALIKKI